MNQPLVTSIVPVYNGERFLASTLDSVFAQEYHPLEVIVVDDGSTDNSANIAQSYEEVRYIYQSNQGVPVARNAGIAAAQGEFIAFLDQDDLWTPNKLRVQIDHMVNNPELGYVIAKQKIFLEPGTEVPSWLREKFLHGEQMGFLPSALVARASLFKQIGAFDAAHQTASDVEWFFRAKDLGIPMAIIPLVLLHRRIHSDNQSYQLKALHSEYLKIARMSTRKQKAAQDQRS